MSPLPSLFRLLALTSAIGVPVSAQRLQERYSEAARGWETLLEKGDAATVRKAAEALIARETPEANPADYNDQRALVALHDIAARAAVLEGAWEDAVALLGKAASIAKANVEQAEKNLGKVVQDHEAHLAQTRAAAAQLEAKLKESEQMDGMPKYAAEARDRAKLSLNQHKASIAHSEQALVEIRGVLAQLRNLQDLYSKSHASWRVFLEQEQAELGKVGSPAKYAAEKLEQVKADDAKPKSERLAYGRRLLRHDPANAECRRFVNGLLGLEPDPEAKPEPKKAAKPVKRKARRK